MSPFIGNSILDSLAWRAYSVLDLALFIIIVTNSCVEREMGEFETAVLTPATLSLI